MPEVTEYAEFNARLAARSRAASAAVPLLLREMADTVPAPALCLLERTSKAVQEALEDLDAAGAELRAQNDDLFEARTRLEAQAQLYLDLFHAAPLPYVVTDRSGLIRMVNRAAAQLLGRPVNALVGRPLAASVELEERPVFRAGLARVTGGVTPERWPIRLVTRRGASTDVGMIATPMPGTDAAPPAIYWMLVPVYDADVDLL